MKELPIGAINSMLIYDPDTGLLRWRNTTRHTKAGAVAGNQTKRGYWRVGIGGTHYPAHRIAWAISTGRWPTQEIDPINGVKTDNRLENIREVTANVNKQNLRCAKAHNKLGLLGVTATGKRFKATIVLNKKQTYLGTFATAEEASTAYANKKRAMHEGVTI